MRASRRKRAGANPSRHVEPGAVVLRLAPGARLTRAGSELRIRGPASSLRIAGRSAGLVAAVGLLASGGATEKELSDTVVKIDGVEAIVGLYACLHELAAQSLLARSVCSDGRMLATLVPLARGSDAATVRVKRRSRYILSRFAYWRRTGEALVVESPLSRARLILHDPRGIALLGALARPARARDLSASIAGVSTQAAITFLELLLSAEFVSEVGADGRPHEASAPALRQWEFHDLLFHSRSRAGRHANPYGGTNRFVGKVTPPPPVKPPMSSDSVGLFKPNVGRLRKNDVTLTRALETRRSRRDHGPRLVTGRDLGEFLYRSARIHGLYTIDGHEFTRRVYPGGGAAYELEVYVVVDRCSGLDAGLYHYCPLGHRLYRLSAGASAIRLLLKSAADTAHSSAPQVLIVLAARFHRVTWRYESISYATILKDVGVLFQNMYLVATAMGLSACALGGGNSDLFSEAVGTDYYEETSVGEFILGR